ncbi:MAG: M14 family metallopeptidase [Candidatus Flexifilum sp.]
MTATWTPARPAAPAEAGTIAPTRTPRPLMPPTPSSRPTTVPSLHPTATPVPPTLTAPPTVPPPTDDPFVIYPTANWVDDPAWTARLAAFPFEPSTEILALSVEGRPIAARRIGTGGRVLLLVGGIHGGWEANTTGLMFALLDRFAARPGDLPPDTALIIIPAANPDGTARGATPAGRFNARGVDLNRNWGCGWSAAAVWRDRPVDPGPRAFSEPESRALAEYIQRTRPAAVLFYHSAANGIFPGECADAPGSADSQAFSAAVGAASGYPCCGGFSAYAVTGTAAAWIDGQGIPAADVELRRHDALDLEANIAGVGAALAWIAAR